MAKLPQSPDEKDPMRIKFLAVPFLFFALGCGDKGPRLVKVEGTVNLDGAPLPFKNIMFHPEGKTPGAGAGGNTDAKGYFNVFAVRPGATIDVGGIPPGAYRVVLNEPLIPVDIPIAPEGNEPAPAIGIPIAKPVKKSYKIPPIYNDPEKTPLKAEITENGGTFNFELKSKPD